MGRRTWLIVVVLLLVLLGLAAGRLWWTHPLGPELILSRPAAAEAAPPPTATTRESPAGQPTPAGTPLASTPSPTDDASANLAPAGTSRDEPEGEPGGAATPALALTPLPGAPHCDGPPLVYLLAIGLDTPDASYTYGRTDFIRVVRVDFVTPSILILGIPRDLWVTIPGLGEDRINTAYSLGFQNQVPGGGPSLLAQTLSDNLDLQVDHYVVVNFQAAVEAVDAIGGIDIELPVDVDGTATGLPYFSAGRHHMDGETTLQFARIRFVDNDFYRINRQTRVLMAVRDKVLTPKVIPAVPELMDSLRELVLTDLRPADLSTLWCLARMVDTSTIKTVEIDYSVLRSWTSPGGASVLLPDPEGVAAMVRDFKNGTGLSRMVPLETGPVE